VEIIRQGIGWNMVRKIVLLAKKAKGLFHVSLLPDLSKTAGSKNFILSVEVS